MQDSYPLRLFGSLGLIIVGAVLASIVPGYLAEPAAAVVTWLGIGMSIVGAGLLLVTLIRPQHPRSH